MPEQALLRFRGHSPATYDLQEERSEGTSDISKEEAWDWSLRGCSGERGQQPLHPRRLSPQPSPSHSDSLQKGSQTQHSYCYTVFQFRHKEVPQPLVNSSAL
jgi:hypothetical protein